MAKKWQKLKQSRKPHICGIRCLRVKKETLAQVFSSEFSKIAVAASED